MIRSLHIENLRGFETLDVEGLDRVNLIVGRNDAGKTSLMGAAAFGEGPGGLAWARMLAHAGLEEGDFERVWRPLFRGGNTSVPIRLLRTDSSGGTREVEIAAVPRKKSGPVPEVTYRVVGGADAFEEIEYGELVVKHNDSDATSVDVWWSGPYPDPESDLVDSLKKLYTEGKIHLVADAVRAIHPGVNRIDLVGDAVYVLLEGHPLPLPLSVLGDGSRRFLEFAIPVAFPDHQMFIDEIENGFHWSALGKVWDFLRQSKVGQIFATTHREENIRIACECFIAAGDDSLRIVRLDRTEKGHRAVVYTASAALAAMDAGLEIRG